MAPKRLTLAILLVALLLTGSIYFFLPMAAGSNSRPLTPDKLKLLEEKRAALGDPEQISVDSSNSKEKPNLEAIRPIEGQEYVSKNELLEMWNKSWNSEQEHIKQMEQKGGAAQAQYLRKFYDNSLREIEQLPPEGKKMQIPGVHVGEHSVVLSQWTWDQNIHAIDPINLVFFNRGTANDVQYDLRYWASTRWDHASCGGTQWAYIFDSSHGRRDDFSNMAYQLTVGGGCNWPFPRFHLRLFDSFGPDTHYPGFGYWSAGAVHHDNFRHTCTDDWEASQNLVRWSFKDGSGNPLWFVGGFWELWFYNEGQLQCAYNDGWTTYIELTY